MSIGSKTTAANDKISSFADKQRVSASTGNVENDLSNLRNDLANLADSVASLGSTSVKSLSSTAKETYSNMRDSGGELVDYVTTHAKDYEKQITEIVREKPVMAIVAAAGVGILIGLLSRR